MATVGRGAYFKQLLKSNTGMAHGFFLEFQKVENHLEFWKKGKNFGTWKN